MKKILVVSDNPQLVEHLRNESFKEEISKIAEFEFCYSIVNKFPRELILLGLKPIDLKIPEIYNKIINTFDFVFSLHCKQIFPKELVTSVRCINFHPGLNPYNRGWYPQVFSIINKLPAGATIHLMDELVDHGDVIDQKEIQICPDDTSLTLYNRVIELEKNLISKNILSIINEDFDFKNPSSDGNYNSIQDFKNICQLDLSATGTLKAHIDLLRALSHGNFSNAYYFENGKKIYISVNLKSHEDG